MKALFGMMMPSSDMLVPMIQNTLMSSGYDNPTLVRVVSGACAGNYSRPKLISLQPGSFDVPQGSESLMLQAENAEEEVTIVVYSRKKTGKTLDAPNAP